MRLVFPADGISVSSNLRNCREQDGLLTFSQCSVNLLENYITMTFDSDLPLQDSATQVFSVSIDAAIDLPTSIKVVENIVLRTQNGEYQTTSFKAT